MNNKCISHALIKVHGLRKGNRVHKLLVNIPDFGQRPELTLRTFGSTSDMKLCLLDVMRSASWKRGLRDQLLPLLLPALLGLLHAKLLVFVGPLHPRRSIDKPGEF